MKPKFDAKRSAMQLYDEKSTAKTFTEKEKDPEKDRLRKVLKAELQLLCTQTTSLLPLEKATGHTS